MGTAYGNDFHRPRGKYDLVIAAGCGALLGISPVVDAGQVRIEEVVVTAQKQEENIQAVPLAITAITGDDLQRQGITTMGGVVQATPSISFAPFPSSSNTLILYMRGMGNSNPAALTSEGAVGLYEDGFIIARPNAATFDLADVERVEVLRGPQGTLYGRNTTGGAINLISRQPSGEFGFRQQFTAGTRDYYRSLTAIDLPRWQGLSTKLTYLRSTTDGYVKNSDSSHDYGEEAQRAGRLALHWNDGGDFTVDYFFDTGNLDSTPIYYQNESLVGVIPGYTDADGPRRHTYRPIDLNLSTANFEGHGLTLSWDIDSNLTVKSLTGYRRLRTEDYQDYAEAFGYAYNTEGQLNSHHFSQEFTAVGDLFDARVNYTAGVYYFEESGSNNTFTYIPAFGYQGHILTKGESTSYAGYGQLIWTPAVLDDRLSFTLGARYTRDKREAQRFQSVNGFDMADSGTTNDVDFSRFNPSFTASYQWNEDINVYAKVATGYRAGGSYEAAPINGFGRTFSPEDLTSYELGLKSYWFEHRLRLNVAAFDAKYEDMQLTFQVDPINPGVTQIYNAGRATIKGVEVELLLTPIEDLSFNANYSYLNATFDTVDVIAGTIFDPAQNPASPYRVGENIKDLFVLPHAPRHSINFGSDYTFARIGSSAFNAHLDYRWQARAYQTPAAGRDVPGRDLNSQGSYGLLNGRLSMTVDLSRGDRATLGLWGKNLARTNYEQHVIVTGTSVATPLQGAGYTSNAVAWSEPPSWGLDLQYEY